MEMFSKSDLSGRLLHGSQSLQEDTGIVGLVPESYEYIMSSSVGGSQKPVSSGNPSQSHLVFLFQLYGTSFEKYACAYLQFPTLCDAAGKLDADYDVFSLRAEFVNALK